MKTQKLKSLNDFLRRAEIIPHAVLIVTEGHGSAYEEAMKAIGQLEYAVATYEISFLNDSLSQKDFMNSYQIHQLPVFLYFRGKQLSRQIYNFDELGGFVGSLHSMSHQI